jgi:UDP-4-amino-4,6-dideoxy-N-acetyl-beta-L-altrosamine N-acetyltransferase
MIEGERINLLELKEEDNPLIVKWRNKDEVRRNLLSHSILTLESQQIWFEDYQKDDTDQTFIIFVKEDEEKIGTVSLNDIDMEKKDSEYGIMIGEQKYLGKGYAKEATIMILKYAFEHLLLNRVTLKVLDNNLPAIKLYDKLGFKVEEKIKEDDYFEGESHDTIIMSIIKEDYDKMINNWIRNQDPK